MDTTRKMIILYVEKNNNTSKKKSTKKNNSINKKDLYELVFDIYIFGIDDPNEINKVTTIISHINYVVVIYYINFNNNSS